MKGGKKGNARGRILPVSNFIRGQVEGSKGRKSRKEMRERKRTEGKHDFPNISSKCEVYCEKIYDFRYLAISISRDFIIIITYTFLNR